MKYILTILVLITLSFCITSNYENQRVIDEQYQVIEQMKHDLYLFKTEQTEANIRLDKNLQDSVSELMGLYLGKETNLIKRIANIENNYNKLNGRLDITNKDIETIITIQNKQIEREKLYHEMVSKGMASRYASLKILEKINGE